MLLSEQELLERIKSTEYWLGEYSNENCGYREFSKVMADDAPIYIAHIRAQSEALAQKDAELAHVRRALEWIKQQGNSNTDGHSKRYVYQTASFFNIPDFAVQNILRAIVNDALTATKDPNPAP